MTSLGERLTAQRDAARAVAEAVAVAKADEARAAAEAKAEVVAVTKAEDAKLHAQQYTDAIRDAVRTYVDNQITLARAAAKTYVDNQIDKLVAANNLKPPK